jgi:hypothetical protein
VELGGRVAELGADGYIVVASAGDRLRAAISGFPTGSLWLRVSRRGSDTFLDGGGKEPPVISHVISLSLTAQQLR